MPRRPADRPRFPIRSILVLTKHRFLGDSVVAVPLLRGVRRAFPDARLSVLTGPAAAMVLQGCPLVDRIHRYDPHGAQRGLRPFVARMLALRGEERPDLCLVADRSFRSAIAAWLCGGRIRAGFNSEGRGGLLTHRVSYDFERREIECYLDILRAVAPEPPDAPYDPSPTLWISEEERAQGARILAEQGAIRPWRVGLQPGASSPKKQWPTQRFAQVADALAADGWQIVLLGGREEAPIARALREAMRAPAVDLTGMTSLRETMGVVSHLSLFIGNDTGVNHIAAALDIATVALFGPRVGPLSAQKWGNIGPKNAVLVSPDGGLADIGTDVVVSAARRLLPSQALGAAGTTERG